MGISDSGKNSCMFVISGPSGVGKGTLCRMLVEAIEDMVFSVSATSRPKRPEEQDGVDYYFLSPEAFMAKAEQGEMLEWEEYNDNYYGTPRAMVEQKLSDGKSVLMEIDVKGALRVKQEYPEAQLIFLMPPSFEELEDRLTKRGTNTSEDIQARIAIARQEMMLFEAFDHVVVNEDLEKCFAELKALVLELHQVSP